jgi:hypothetical protein
MLTAHSFCTSEKHVLMAVLGEEELGVANHTTTVRHAAMGTAAVAKPTGVVLKVARPVLHLL